MSLLEPTTSSCTHEERTVHSPVASLSSTTLFQTPPLHNQFGPYTILNHSGERAEIVKKASTAALSQGSPELGQLSLLHSLIDTTITRLGSAALLRDITHPPTSLAVTMQRRAAIMELRDNTALRESLENALKKTQEIFYTAYSTEEWALRIFTPEVADRSEEKTSLVRRLWLGIQNFCNDERALMIKLKALGKLVDLFTALPQATSQTITDHISNLRALASSDDGGILHGHVQRGVFGPLYAPGEAPWYEPTFAMHSGSISFDKIALSNVTTAGLLFFGKHLPISESAVRYVAAAQVGLLLLRRSKTGPQLTQEAREKVSSIPKLFDALDAIGELDALLALSKLPERIPTPSCFPQLVESPRYTFTATNLHNPCQALTGHSVPNDLSVSGGTVMILTGPNSGGKSTLSTALFQNQILAQLGTCIAAEAARMSVADTILFQGPTFAALKEHGRFGTELLETKSTFMRATPKSLVILD